jgi:hypothetical protein
MCGDPLAGHGPKRMHRILAQVPERYSRARVHERDGGSGNHAYVAPAAVALGSIDASARWDTTGQLMQRLSTNAAAMTTADCKAAALPDMTPAAFQERLRSAR